MHIKGLLKIDNFVKKQNNKKSLIEVVASLGNIKIVSILLLELNCLF